MGRIGVATSLRRASGLTSSRVVRCEKAGGTSQRGKANEHGLVHVCVLGRDETRRPDQLARTGASRAEAASLYRKGTWRDAPPCRRSRSCGALSRLEPDEAKVSRPVLRGGGGRKTTSLPDSRFKVVARGIGTGRRAIRAVIAAEFKCKDVKASDAQST